MNNAVALLAFNSLATGFCAASALSQMRNGSCLSLAVLFALAAINWAFSIRNLRILSDKIK